MDLMCILKYSEDLYALHGPLNRTCPC